MFHSLTDVVNVKLQGPIRIRGRKRSCPSWRASRSSLKIPSTWLDRAWMFLFSWKARMCFEAKVGTSLFSWRPSFFHRCFQSWFCFVDEKITGKLLSISLGKFHSCHPRNLPKVLKWLPNEKSHFFLLFCFQFSLHFSWIFRWKFLNCHH